MTAKTSPSGYEPGTSSYDSPPISLTPLQFKENPDAWLMVDKILQDATYPQTKCKETVVKT